MKSFEQARQLVAAGASVVCLASYEWERVRGLVHALDRERPVQVWSATRGRQQMNDEGRLVPLDGDGIGQHEPFSAIEALLDEETPTTLLLEDIHPYLREEHHLFVRLVREVAQLGAACPHIVVLGMPSASLPIELVKEVPVVELPLPDASILETVVEQVADEQGVTFDGSEALLEAARGLTVMEARLAFGQAAVVRRRLDGSAVDLVAREKERVIRQSGVLEYYEPGAGMADVGGLDQLKVWLTQRGRAFGAGARDFGLDPPKGALLLGVQGCGKSLLAKAVAATWQFPLLRFDLGRVFAGLVGQSEANIRAALDVAQALAPCVLWIDEIEKGLAGVQSSDGTDGGTTARVVGTLLTWMQEKTAPVFVVATANRIEMLPPELLRKGRFDEIFFVDLPTEAARREILSIHLEKKGRPAAGFDLDALARSSVGYSGAELEEAVRDGLFAAFDAGEALSTTHIEAALAATWPLSRTMREEIQALRKWASVRARTATGEAPESLPDDEAGREVPRLRQERRNPFMPAGAS